MIFTLPRKLKSIGRIKYLAAVSVIAVFAMLTLLPAGQASADIQVSGDGTSATCRFVFITVTREQWFGLRDSDYGLAHEEVSEEFGIPVEALQSISINGTLPNRDNAPGDANNMIIGVSTTGADNENHLCGSYSFLQSSSNEAVYSGAVAYYLGNDFVLCETRFSFSGYNGNASGTVNGTLSESWSQLGQLDEALPSGQGESANCSSAAGRSTNSANAVGLPDDTVAIDFLGDPGTGSGGNPQQPGGGSGGTVAFRWHDITEIGLYRGSSSTPAEVYKLTPNEWSGHSGSNLVYELTTSDDDARERLIGRTTADDSCTPRIVFSSEGSGSGSMDINFDGGEDYERFVQNLNGFMSQGAKTGTYHDYTPDGTTCINHTETSTAIGDDNNRKVFWRYYPDDGGGATISMPFMSAGSNEQRFFGLSYTYDEASNTWTATVPGCDADTPSTITGSGNGVRPSIGNSVTVTWRLVSPDDGCDRLAVDGVRMLGSAGDATINAPIVDSDTTPDDSCESNSGVLGWIMCPLAGILDGVTGWLDSQVQGLLIIKDDYFSGTSGQALQNAWRQIRNVAFIILIPVMLVMVIGTAMGVESFSAYTVRRALPRMVAAIIFITLSWYICVFLVGFFNVVGTGARGLVVTPFNEVQSSQVEACVGVQTSLKGALTAAGIVQPVGGDDCTPSVADNVEGVAGQVTLGLVATGSVIAGFALGAISLMSILSLLATAALVLGAMFLLLMLRQMFIIALIMLAPLAILAWIFPGNDKLWKLWWGAFSKLLMIFPLIMIMIGVGQVFALISGTALAESSSLVATILIVLAYIAPFFFIPFAFKWAGGVFANIAGMVNDKNRGPLDRLKKGRSERRAKDMQEKGAPRKARIDGWRYKTAQGAMAWSSRDGRGRRAGWVGRRAAATIGGGNNWNEKNSARTAEEGKRVQAEKDTGDDSQVRGSTANLALIERLQASFDDKKAAHAEAQASGDADAIAATKVEMDAAEEALGQEFRVKNGQRQVRTLSGSWVSEAAAREGHRRAKGNRGWQQGALAYELSKARLDHETSRVAESVGTDSQGRSVSRTAALASDMWGLSDDEAGWAWKGATFNNQGLHLEWKHTDSKTGRLKKTDRPGSYEGEALVEEWHATRGSYQASQFSAEAMKALKTAWDNAKAANDEAGMQKIAEIMQTFQSRGYVQGEEDENGQTRPVMTAQGRAASGVTSQGAAGFESALQALYNDADMNRILNPTPPPAAPRPAAPQPAPQPGVIIGPDGRGRQSGGPGSGGVILDRSRDNDNNP